MNLNMDPMSSMKLAVTYEVQSGLRPHELGFNML